MSFPYKSVSCEIDQLQWSPVYLIFSSVFVKHLQVADYALNSSLNGAHESNLFVFVFVRPPLSAVTMPLFEVPDWKVRSSVQPSVHSTKPSKKRKRTAYEAEPRLSEAAFEKLIKQLEGGSILPKGRKKVQSESIKLEKKAERASSKADERLGGPKEKKSNRNSKEKPSNLSEDNKTIPPKKKQKRNKTEQTHAIAEDEPKPQKLSKSNPPNKFGLTPLQSKMKATLDGARFR